MLKLFPEFFLNHFPQNELLCSWDYYYYYYYFLGYSRPRKIQDYHHSLLSWGHGLYFNVRHHKWRILQCGPRLVSYINTSHDGFLFTFLLFSKAVIILSSDMFALCKMQSHPCFIKQWKTGHVQNSFFRDGWEVIFMILLHCTHSSAQHPVLFCGNQCNVFDFFEFSGLK